MNKQLVVVVIPIHSENPTPYELISFRQCFKVLSKYDIVVIAPNGLSLQKYREQVVTFRVLYIDSSWLSSILKYNKLKLSNFFYSLFKDYNYLLTYELDAFVFKDELTEWCNKGYDYIGAPWFDGYTSPTLENKIVGVGNSGFSLRNIYTIRGILKHFYFYNPKESSGRKNKVKNFINYPFRKLKNLTGENFTIQKYYDWYEDYFFSTIVPTKVPDFKIAPVNDAMKFSFEVNPEILYEINDRQLPFGCHAWLRYNVTFWKPYIEKEGYTVN